MDIQQDVAAQVWQAVRRPGFDFAAGFWGFVEVVTTRRCIDWLRRRRPVDPLDTELPGPTADPLDAAIARERSELAHEALGRLDPACRQLLYLHAVVARSYREIGEIMGKSEGALRVQLHRCVKRAREVLRGLVTTEPEG
ncbi:MAG: sigma-70 family RNA polymerase sigma factor [Acidobacteriota bacterium]